MFADNHHSDGHVAAWLPVPDGFQSSLIEAAPAIYFKPPYVGVRGWVGIELANIEDKDLHFHIQTAWELVAPKRLLRSITDKGILPQSHGAHREKLIKAQ
jgi:hypothetical protein